MGERHGPSKSGVSDPDGWISYWLSLHEAPHFAEHFNSLVLECLSDPFSEGAGSSVLAFTEDDGREIEAEVKYILEQFPRGRVLHLDSIRSAGDPLPPWALD